MTSGTCSLAVRFLARAGAFLGAGLTGIAVCFTILIGVPFPCGLHSSTHPVFTSALVNGVRSKRAG